MAAKSSIPIPTGLFIPVEKQSLFMLTFEDMLVTVHNTVPIFGSATDNNTREVILNYLGSKSYKPESIVSDIQNALKFLKTNMSILGPRQGFKRKRKSSSVQCPPQIINLEDESEERTVDLTNCNQSQPEIIVLEDSIVHSARKTRQSSRNSSIVDLTNLSECNSVIAKDTDEIMIVSEKPSSSQGRRSSINIKTPPKATTPKNKKRKRKKSRGKSLTRTIYNHSAKSKSSISFGSPESLPKKKRKLQDISNTPSSSTSSSLGQSSTTNRNQLSENTLKYYEAIAKAVSKSKGKKKKNTGNNIPVVISPTSKNMKLRSQTRKLSPVKQHVAAANIGRTVNPQTSFRNINTSNNQRVFGKNSFNQFQPGRNNRYNTVRTIGETNSFNPNPEVVLDGLRPIVVDGCNVAIGHENYYNNYSRHENYYNNYSSHENYYNGHENYYNYNHQRTFEQYSWNYPYAPLPGLGTQFFNHGICNSKRIIGETNSFNPHPFKVASEGLRPIAIDGCNVAIGHGKGKFSPKGLKICVDYFAARGHTKIKVFLPKFRQSEFSTELLESLKTKSDVVFTPSQYINGQRRTPYDDRFIVQYATEFGGVIVSTDNYRDLSKENPRWQDTIAKRLLMFTWVDDFLMFPVDPLGRSGPTLEDFLRF